VTPYRLTHYGISEVGLVRRHNEDRWDAVVEKNFFVLADGMGGHLGGDIAAEQTVATLCAFAREDLPTRPEAPIDAMRRLRRGIDFANEAVYAQARSDRNLRGMGSTLTCLYFTGDEVVYAHVGDSRIYRIRNKHIKRLTSDHSLVTELLESGHISEEEAERFIYRHVITRAMGTRLRVEPDIAHEAIQKDDFYLMCSDGLTDLLRDHELLELIAEAASLQEATEHVRAVVLERGATDNFTMVLIRVDAP
jgi:PPM family protein phosphatase